MASEARRYKALLFSKLGLILTLLFSSGQAGAQVSAPGVQGGQSGQNTGGGPTPREGQVQPSHQTVPSRGGATQSGGSSSQLVAAPGTPRAAYEAFIARLAQRLNWPLSRGADGMRPFGLGGSQHRGVDPRLWAPPDQCHGLSLSFNSPIDNFETQRRIHQSCDRVLGLAGPQDLARPVPALSPVAARSVLRLLGSVSRFRSLRNQISLTPSPSAAAVRVPLPTGSHSDPNRIPRSLSGSVPGSTALPTPAPTSTPVGGVGTANLQLRIRAERQELARLVAAFYNPTSEGTLTDVPLLNEMVANEIEAGRIPYCQSGMCYSYSLDLPQDEFASTIEESVNRNLRITSVDLAQRAVELGHRLVGSRPVSGEVEQLMTANDRRIFGLSPLCGPYWATAFQQLIRTQLPSLSPSAHESLEEYRHEVYEIIEEIDAFDENVKTTCLNDALGIFHQISESEVRRYIDSGTSVEQFCDDLSSGQQLELAVQFGDVWELLGRQRYRQVRPSPNRCEREMEAYLTPYFLRLNNLRSRSPASRCHDFLRDTLNQTPGYDQLLPSYQEALNTLLLGEETRGVNADFTTSDWDIQNPTNGIPGSVIFAPDGGLTYSPGRYSPFSCEGRPGDAPGKSPVCHFDIEKAQIAGNPRSVPPFIRSLVRQYESRCRAMAGRSRRRGRAAHPKSQPSEIGKDSASTDREPSAHEAEP